MCRVTLNTNIVLNQKKDISPKVVIAIDIRHITLVYITIIFKFTGKSYTIHWPFTPGGIAPKPLLLGPVLSTFLTKNCSVIGDSFLRWCTLSKYSLSLFRDASLTAWNHTGKKSLFCYCVYSVQRQVPFTQAQYQTFISGPIYLF